MSDPDQELPEKVLRVSGGTDCQKLGAAIAHVVSKGAHKCLIESVGAGAGNQAEKAIITANGMLARQGVYVSVVPSFVTRIIDGNERNAIQRSVLTHKIG